MGTFLSKEETNNEKLTPFYKSVWKTNGELHTKINSKQLKSLLAAWGFSQHHNPRNTRNPRNPKKTILDEMLDSNSKSHYDKLKKYLDNTLTLNFKFEKIGFYADVVGNLESYLKCVHRKIERNVVDEKKEKSTDDTKEQQYVFTQHMLNLTDKQNICRLVLVRLSIADTYFKIMKMYREKYNVEEFQNCKKRLEKMIFLALSCKDTYIDKDLSVLNMNKGLEILILDKITSFKSHINSLPEFICRFKELKTISRVTDTFYMEFVNCLQNIDMEQSELGFPLFKIDLFLDKENDIRFKEFNKANKSSLIKFTKQSESYFIYYVDKETMGSDVSKLTVITYFHSPNLYRLREIQSSSDGKKKTVRNYYGLKFILDVLDKKGLSIISKPKKIKK